VRLEVVFLLKTVRKEEKSMKKRINSGYSTLTTQEKRKPE